MIHNKGKLKNQLTSFSNSLCFDQGFDAQALLLTSNKAEGTNEAWSCEHNVVLTLAGCLFTRGLR